MTFHPGFPVDSIRINLLQNFNRSSELASRISGLMPSGGDNAPFQAFAQKAVDAVVQGYPLCGQRPTLIIIPLSVPVLLIPAMAWLTALSMGWWTANWQKKI